MSREHIETALAAGGPFHGLSKYPQFLNYKLVPRKNTPGKMDKVPQNAGGINGTLITAEEAISKVRDWNREGIAFVLKADDPFWFLDIDSAFNNGWSTLSAGLYNRLRGAGYETSTSGTGMHIIGTGKAPEHGCKNEKLGLEFYTEKRLIALTGLYAEGDVLADKTAEIGLIVAEYFPPDNASAHEVVWEDAAREGWRGPEDDDELLTMMLTSTPKGVDAAAVFGGGEIKTRLSFADVFNANVDALAQAFPTDQPHKEYDYSSADMSLASRLAFWTGCNPLRMRRIMELSELKRDKWDDRYLEMTITKACARCDRVYGQVRQWNDAPTGAVDVLPLEELPRKLLPVNANDHYKDANGLIKEIFSDRLGGFDGVTHWWEGRVWEFAPDALLRRHAARALDHETVKISSSRIAGTVAILKDQLPIMGTLNPKSVLVFFQNCVVNAYSGDVLAHDRAFRNGYLLGCEYVPDAKCDAWQSWLAEIFESDRQRAVLLQEIFGWSLITDNLEIQKAVALVGVPRGGKGTILSILTRILGEAAGAFQLADLVDDKVLAGMMNRNVAIDYDAASPDKKNARQVTGRFKAITANEPVAVRLLYTQSPFQGRLNCKLVLAANSVPTLWDDSGASANRWVPLVFDKSYLGKEDSGLADRLAAELPGIALWAVEGLQRLIAAGKFTMPQSSQDELDSLIDSASPLERFIDECCVADGDSKCREGDLWQAYTAWAIRHQFDPGNRKAFMHAFRDSSRSRGVLWKRRVRFDEGPRQGFVGVRLVDAPPEKSNVAYLTKAP